MVQFNAHRLDAVFGALADPTRRAVLARLERGDASVGELAQPFGMSLTGFIKHLGILEDAGLIERQKTGRVVSCNLKQGALADARAWLERHERFWNARLDRLGAYLDRKEQQRWSQPPTKTPASPSGASTPTTSPSSTRRVRTRRR